MIAELTVLPLGRSPHISLVLAEILADLRAQGIPHQVTATCTCLEGSWDEIMVAAKRAHAIARKQTQHVVTLLKLEDDAEASNPIAGQSFPAGRVSTPQLPTSRST